MVILFENVSLPPNGLNSCTSKNTTFLLFDAFVYHPILEGIFPIVLAIYLWKIKRKQIEQLNNQEFVRQMIRMLFISNSCQCDCIVSFCSC